jgi:RNA polymerase sigma factor for flagellar operon FliA
VDQKSNQNNQQSKSQKKQKGQNDQNPPNPNDDILKYTPLVKNIANYFFNINSGVELDDCIQEGFVGLLMAKKRYDSSTGVSLGAFAQRYIFGKIYRSLLGTKNLQHNKKIILMNFSDNIVDKRKNIDEYYFELFDSLMVNFDELKYQVLQLILHNYKKNEILKQLKITKEFYDKVIDEFKQYAG